MNAGVIAGIHSIKIMNLIKTFWMLCTAASVFSACNNDAKTKGDKKQQTTANKNNRNAKIRNDIQLNAKDVKVSQAFLLYEDGTLVPATNETNVNEPVKLRLVIDEGWKQNAGKVSLGASERIETNDGLLVLDEKDLFKDIASIDTSDAHFVTLTANISRVDKLYDYFLVSFRVWDKNSTGEINGSYKLYIK
ncbi:MAG: hypothetical protein ABR502_04845 [Chitinophagaceae bacterium]